jgi:hypothetical protein
MRPRADTSGVWFTLRNPKRETGKNLARLHLLAGMTCRKPLAAICVTQALTPTPRFDDEAALSEEIWYTGL